MDWLDEFEESVVRLIRNIAGNARTLLACSALVDSFRINERLANKRNVKILKADVTVRGDQNRSFYLLAGSV